MSPYHPTMRWRGTDLCSRWFGNGLGLDCGKLMDLDRSGALNVLAGNPTTQMPRGLAVGFLENPYSQKIQTIAKAGVIRRQGSLGGCPPLPSMRRLGEA